MNSKLNMALGAIALFFSSFVGAQTTDDDLCKPSGYVIGYFNGVASDSTSNAISINRLKRKIGTRLNGEDIQYREFRNPTEGFYKDIAESYAMRVAADPSLAGKYDVLWQNLRRFVSPRPGDISPSEAIRNFISDIALDREKEEFRLAAENSNFAPIVNGMIDQMRPLVLEGRKVLMVAHSQGNLFANSVLGKLNEDGAKENLRLVHVAPAGGVADRDYVLSNLDKVIAAVSRIIGGVPAANIVMSAPIPAYDTGHEFVSTYMNPAKEALIPLVSDINKSLSQLKIPSSGSIQGFFTVTLTWNGVGDADLHVIEPNGTQVYYANKLGDSGSLDFDNTVASGPEHYTSVCNAKQLQTGSYAVGVNNYSGAQGRTATVVLSTNFKTFTPRSFVLGQGGVQPAFNVVVTKDANGAYDVALQ